jgi:hypothetical protein
MEERAILILNDPIQTAPAPGNARDQNLKVRVDARVLAINLSNIH